MYVYLFGLNYFRGCDSTPFFLDKQGNSRRFISRLSGACDNYFFTAEFIFYTGNT